MATFRNNQIEEILNDERKLNRTIMDRQKQHVSSIGDQRAPPSMRDIKLEAILGTQIDQLKEDINKSIQLISGFQYGKLDEKKIDRLLKLNTRSQAQISIEPATTILQNASAPPNEGKEEEEDNTDGQSTNVNVQPIAVYSNTPLVDETSGDRDGVPGQPPPQ
jgi:hypothetical protein